jgi:thiamine biosynthesis protein ThiI
VLRPLLAHDKEEIIREARRIGTYSLSEPVQEYCQLVPQKPVTACRVEAAEREESRFDVGALVDETVATLRTIALKTVTGADLVGPYLYTEAVPDAAVVVDCRSEDEYGAWHYPGAINLELHELLASFKRLDKARTYVLYCPVGLQSAVAAEAMQNAGYQAYSLRGGLRGWRQKEKPVS